jgi:Tol biopolymer transport system component/DNA-binding winged helix-turn-helix (wHTH) protein
VLERSAKLSGIGVSTVSGTNITPAVLRFGVFEVDLRTQELRKQGLRLRLPGQSFQVLRLLLERPGELVNREELRGKLWPADTFGDFDHGVNAAVNRLREALGDSADSPKFIETLPRRGYRFIVPVEWSADAAGGSALPSVVAITAPEPTPIPQPIPPERNWKLRGTIALAATAVMASAVFLSNEDSYLSRTRVGTWLRHAAIGRQPEPQLALSQRRLTANTDDASLTGGVISPDGKYLAYTDTSGFYLRQVDGGETHPVPLPKGFDPLPESWFPDSAHLVVTRFGDQRNPPHLGKQRARPPSLWKISVMGGTPRKLADEGSSARVSPDGSKIAYLAGKWDIEQIWLMEADGNNPRKIVDGGQESFGAVAWAPDAKRFAYVRTTNPSQRERPAKQIEVFDVTGGRREVILSEPRLGDQIAWMNTGRLIYSLDEAEPNHSDANLWWVQLNPRPGRPASPPTRITNDRAHISGISVAADGKRMALLRSTFQTDGYVTEIEAQGRQLSTPRRYTLDEGWDWPTSWTPDSKAVVFISDRDGPPHIFRQGVDETQPELLVGGNDVLNNAPRSTPDGLSVLYLVNGNPDKPSDNFRLMRVPVSGGPSQFVLEGAGIENYQCARLPSTVCIYGQIEPKSEYLRFFTFDPAGAKGTELLAGKIKKADYNWSLSPDGKYLVNPKSENPYEAPVLRIFNLDEDTEQYIPVPGIGLMMGLDWAADSKSVWVVGYMGMGRGAWGTRSGVLNVALSGRATMVLEGLSPAIWFAIPSPDGRRLSLCELTERSNMWLLENF